MKQIITWQVSIKVGKGYYVTDPHSTPEEAFSEIVPSLEELQQHYTQVTIVRNVRTVAQP